MPHLELKVSFPLKFGSLFSVMRDSSSVPFKMNLYMIWPKGAHQGAKLETFLTAHVKFHQNCTLIGSFFEII